MKGWELEATGIKTEYTCTIGIIQWTVLNVWFDWSRQGSHGEPWNLIFAFQA